VVYNPIKVDLVKLERIVANAEPPGAAPTLWFATTEEEPGRRAAAAAISGGADVVLAAGGDGTVRAVASALRGSGVPLALLPMGTGNLLARNLGMPLSNIEESVHIAFTGANRKIDIGVAEIYRPDGIAEERVFLVMAGLGLDAKMIAKTNSRLKKAVGWLAYVDGGMRALPELVPVRLRYSLDGAPERPMTVHTIIVGNCGALPGGILLMPDARPDDGILDIAALRPRGPFGWFKVWNKLAWENGVLRRSAAGRRIIDLTADVRDVTYLTAADLRVTVETAQEFQLDGDEFGKASAVHTWVDPGALTVKVRAGAEA
jgi:diacylglycerol kinase (ATP)